MNTGRRKRSARFDRQRAIVRRFIMLATYRFCTLFFVGIMPLVAHYLVSAQTERPESRPWVAPELWLLSLVMWGSVFAESLAQETDGLRRYLARWGGFSGVITSAYAYGSLIAHAAVAKALNEVFLRWPIYATIGAVVVFMVLQYHEMLARATRDVAEE
jgi:hypothetical protein